MSSAWPLPAAGDVVWCRFPHLPGRSPGPKPRPALVLEVTEREDGAEVKVVYQTVADLHEACPNSPGDWYFTGEYPTPGGYRVLNTAYLNWRKGADGKRAYEV